MTAAANANVTPMMAQFLGIKENYRDALLFYRMGDFYEMFFDDAVAAAAALDIALTKRGKHLGQDIPMCGVPVHAAENYLMTLIRKGFRVAVCEQMESPAEARKRGSKSVVKRDVVRLVTPGTLTEETLLNARQNNYLCAFADVRGHTAFAWCDISTGAFRVADCPRVSLGPMLARLSASELLVSGKDADDMRDLADDMAVSLYELAPSSFDSNSAKDRLQSLFDVSSLDGFAAFSRAQLGALGAIVEYLDLTQRGKRPMLRPPVQEATRAVMAIDAATRRNLELAQSMSGGRDGSLLATIDLTTTGVGSRMLEAQLSAPSTDTDLIRNRLDAVSFFEEQPRLREDIRALLKRAPDIERALSRLTLDRGGPRDLTAIRDGLIQARHLADALGKHKMPELLVSLAKDLSGHEPLIGVLEQSLVAEPPLLARDGGFVAEGHDGDLDEARALRDKGRGVIAGMQSDYAAQTSITSLKIKHNNVLGYFIETPATHAEKMLAQPLSDSFIHRQTTANAVRFTTVDLSSLETRILNAGGRALEIEQRIFATLRQHCLEAGVEIFAASAALAQFDVSASMSELATTRNWNRPVVNNSRAFRIEAGRHPVVEAAMMNTRSGTFIPNDCDLGAGGEAARPIWLLTGPNMAGKSTYLRQNALIAVLAQSGSFVPAKAASIGVVNQLFSRVGASDDLARGRSTFMVEMVETAAILNQASDRALVILDEIGRGTATYDGLSIAWAALEYLHDVNNCRALFATHYHELTALTQKLNGLKNATVAVKEWEGDIIFLHQVKDGAADRSYGVQVAKLAGLPQAVVERARTVLDTLEAADTKTGKAGAMIDDLPLFSAKPSEPVAPARTSGVEERLKTILPDSLTPREALDLIYELKADLPD